ncbi:MAG TPA: HlyD family efflux transporter periplasmic adaptor subunit [Pyrinomonadaceae bacterium]
MDIPRNATTSKQMSMDIPRPSKSHKRYARYSIYFLCGLVAVVLTTISLGRIKPAAPGVDRSTVWVDTVKRGPMMREVRGNGTLVPRDVRVIAASTEGRIERILVQPGEMVGVGSVLIELTNAELEQTAADAQFQVSAAEAEYNNLKTRLDSERLSQQAGAATVRADYQQAQIQSDTDEVLAKDGLIPPLNLRLSRVKAEELANRYKIEQQRLEVGIKTVEAQLTAQRTRVTQLQALAQLRRSQVERLSVRAGNSGVLQEIQVEVGQQVTPGTVLARVVEPSQLKAELRIPETQAKDVQLGQVASIDTRNGVVTGRVQRIDPAVQEGTVTVDVELTGALPQGARPDLSIDGTIELERLEDVLYVGRPTFGQTDSTVGLFKIEDDGKNAVRVQVKLGRSSINKVEILEGLREGDQMILSDTSAWDAFNRITLN